MNFSILTESTAPTKIWILSNEDKAWFYKEFENINEKLFNPEKENLYWTDKNGEVLGFLSLGEGTKTKTIQQALRRVLNKNQEKVDQHLSLHFAPSLDSTQVTQSLIGFILGGYHADFYRKERKENYSKLQVDLISGINDMETILSRSEKIASAMIGAMELVDLPPSVKTPEYLANWAVKSGKAHGFEVKVLDEKQAKEQKLDAFLAVGRGSAKASKFIIMEYHPENKKYHLGLVGKGVTFDTGGLSIKTQGMHHMKSDMGGAAAVLGAISLIASLGLDVAVTAIVPAVENAVSKEAFLPSEVIYSYSGLSIEVIDTDAEGRLILADGLSYLKKNYQTDYLIDLATLTGSSVGTFGYECGALFTKDESLSSKLMEAGNTSSEKVWPLPLWDSYGKEMDSDIADIKNYHGKPIAGAITAAKFLEAFTDKHSSWAHLDIAGVAFGDSEFSKSKTGTAFGVQLLLNFIETELNHG